MPNSLELFEEVNGYVFDLLKNNLHYEFVYHNYQHTLETVEACKKIAEGVHLGDEEYEILLLAAWFHDTGYTEDYKNHEEESIKIAEKYLKEKKYPSERIPQVLRAIRATKRESEPEDIISQILMDADISNIGEKTFFTKSELLRVEWENLGIISCDDLDWEKSQLEFLLSSHFHTQYAQEIFGEQQNINIRDQRYRLQKLEKKHEKEIHDKERIKAQPKRGIETMFRSVYRNHINLSSIADNKANMMISINSLIISITLTIVGAKFSIFGTSFSEDQKVIFPIISLLLTSLFAIIFAILSAKPKVTSNITDTDITPKSRSSILFFGNFTNLPLEKFEDAMVDLMKSEEQLYGNMIKDLYFLGKVLRTKYRLLTISYLVFMFGLIITVLMSIVVVVYLKQTD